MKINKPFGYLFLTTFYYFLTFTSFTRAVNAEEYGVIIGVSEEYRKGKSGDIIFNESPEFTNNSENIKNAWIEYGMNPGNIRVVTGGETTMQGIQDAMNEIAKTMGSDDTLNIVWTGHTITGTGQLVANDGVLKDNDLSNWIKKMPPKKINVFLDVCYACKTKIGPISGKDITKLGAVGPDDVAKPFVLDEPGMKYPEVKGMGSYHFSKAFQPDSPGGEFARADQNRDGIVDMWEVQDYMLEQPPLPGAVAWESKLVPWAQTPCIKEDRSAKGVKEWMKKLNHGRIVFKENINAKFDKTNLSASSSVNAELTIEFDLKRQDLSSGAIPEEERISYKSKRGSIVYSINQKANRTHKMGNINIPIDSKVTGHNSLTFGASYDDFVELDLYPQAGMYKLVFNTNSILVETETREPDKPPNRTNDTVKFEFTSTYDLNADKGRIDSSDEWTIKEYIDALGAAASAGIKKGPPKKEKKENRDLLKQYPRLPTLSPNLPIAIAIDPEAYSSGTMALSWAFERKEPTEPEEEADEEEDDEEDEEEEEDEKEEKEEPVEEPPQPTEPSREKPPKPGKSTFPIKSEAEKFAERILMYYMSGNYSAMYTNMSRETQAAMPYEGWEGVFKMHKRIYGNLLSYERQDIEVPPAKVEMFLIDYSAKFEKSDGIIGLVIIKEGGVLRLKTFIVNASLPDFGIQQM